MLVTAVKSPPAPIVNMSMAPATRRYIWPPSGFTSMSVTLVPPPADVFEMSVKDPVPLIVKPRTPSVPAPLAYRKLPVVSNVSCWGSNSGVKLRGEPVPDSDPSGLIVKNEILDVFAV